METQTETELELAPRLTLRGVLHEILIRIFSLDRGWLHTARELTVAPGPMIRRYVEGRRREYTNPFQYLVAAALIQYVVQFVVDYQDRMVEGMKITAGQTPAQAAFIDMTTEILFSNMVWFSLFIFLPVAVLLRLFFLRGGRNLAEILVFALYSGGHMAVLGTVLIAGSFLYRPGGTFHSVSGVVLAIAYTSWAARGFFPGGAVARVIKVGAAWLLSYALLIVLAGVFAVVWALSSGIAAGGDWNLVHATEKDLLPVVSSLLEEGADPDMTRDRTALHVAVEMGHAEIAELLLAKGADINARDHLGRTPLFLAVLGRRSEMARTLRNSGADATVLTNRGSSLLVAAAGGKDVETARWAIAKGVDVNATRSEGPYVTALMVAAVKADLEMVELLLEHGADASIQNQEGQIALDLARGDKVKQRLRAASGVSSGG